MTLTPAATTVWAKSARGDGHFQSGDGAPVTRWLPLHQHLTDSAGIAAKLWDEGFWAPSIRRRLTVRYEDASVARAATILLAENHDIGKTSPAFSVQCRELTHDMGANRLRVSQHIGENPDRSAVRHEIVSYLAFDEWAASRGAKREVRKQLASVLGVHHGRPLTADRVEFARTRPLLVGEGDWASVRREFLDRAAANPEVAPHLDKILETELRQSDLVLLSGMLILTDWIASSEAYFPLFELEERSTPNVEQRTEAAWRRFAPARSWYPDPSPDDDALFRERFRLPAGASIHAAQRALIAAAREEAEQRLLILEAPMGSGKTEAALAAAEVLAARYGANGLFVALPTQATSDGMFSRVRQWADTAGLGTSIFLAHGRSALNDEFDELWEDPGFIGIDETGAGDSRGSSTRRAAKEGAVIAHRWFAGSKRGPLSNLVVGTIDQVLFMTLQSRHLTLRHLALAGKVVVIDEVHAFDDYMGEFLLTAVQWLGAYGVPTVILSATLPAARRCDLVRAYEEGRLLDEGGQPRVRGRSRIDTGSLEGDIGYPVIVSSGVPPSLRLPGWEGHRQRIGIERIGDAPEELVALLRDRLSDGGCAAVVHNTVGRAQATAARLRAEFPDVPVILAHSRFIAEDRARRDRELLDLFGAPGRARQRPACAIVVATQVIEQSLDLDFDLMVSDIAPVDLLLQRSGRLHRHRRAPSDRPEELRSPRLCIAGVSWQTDPPQPEKGSRTIYGEHLLLRTLAELEERDSVALPDDIAPMVQRVYSEHEYALLGWETELAEARKRAEAQQARDRNEAGPFMLEAVPREPGSLLNWAGYSVGDADGDTGERRGRAVVRRTGETLEVFALFEVDTSVSVAPWWELPDGVVPLNGPPERGLVRGIRRSAITIPEHECRRYGRAAAAGNRECPWFGIDLLIRDLEELTLENQQLRDLQQAKELRGELMVVFDEGGRCRLPHAVLHYSEDEGLRVMHD